MREHLWKLGDALDHKSMSSIVQVLESRVRSGPVDPSTRVAMNKCERQCIRRGDYDQAVRLYIDRTNRLMSSAIAELLTAKQEVLKQ